ncbi:MMPL family transporter [Nocardioides sp. CER19]|uniref:MMPL family transporter n=1 Tax=Nocardioides sp. CER19 TaxID=3038538 RepID=UPI00244B5CFC|nr:MMPL family transporter [Nocardioides sp. CER19]MDH2416267.1 MMPL family transporter [Nocardioides sp. CER19]
MKTLARWSFHHRWIVLALWLVALIGVRAVGAATGTDYTDKSQPPGTDSTRVQQLLEAASPAAGGDTSRIVFATRSGTLSDPVERARVERTLAAVADLPHVVSVTSPFAADARDQIAPDGRIGFATLHFDELAEDLPSDAVDHVIDTARAHQGDGLRIELGGEAISQQEAPSLGGVGFGLLAAAVVLFLAFGSLVAMGLPLVTAVVSVGISLGVIDILSNALAMPTFTTQLASLIGLGVGVDYAMFIVSRYRSSLLRGDSPERATVTAVDTSGRAVLFAGITVCIALLGMFAIGLTVFDGVAIGASIAVVITVVAALTLQPALLGLFGTHVLSRRTRRRVAAGDLDLAKTGLWGAWATGLRRRPSLHAGVGLVAIVLLAVPFLSLRLGFPDAGNEPTSTTSRHAFDLLAEGFGPGFNGPLVVVADRADPSAVARFRSVLGDLAATPGVAEVGPAATVGAGSDAVQVAQLIPSTAPQDQATTDLVQDLRHDVVPGATAAGDPHVLIGGVNAVNIDFSHTISRHLVPFIGLVIALSFLLLAAVFRSLLVPLIAAVMNLLSVAAAFGVVTAVFEKGWGSGLIGLESTAPVEPFIPVIVFAILFGLSMDYEVFLVARMHEIWRRTDDHSAAVTGGLAETGRIITAAAAIMVCVFSAFILGDNRTIKVFGLGLASAILIDALIVRTLIMPAVMLLLGRSTWAMPAALDRLLPRLDVEGEHDDLDPDEELAVAGQAVS